MTQEINYRELCRRMRTAAANAEHREVSIPMSKTIVLDTETTGLRPAFHEILQLSIMDAEDGRILYDQYFKPMIVAEWREAAEINHITPDMVAKAPYLVERMGEIQKIISDAETLIGYNANFDISFLKEFGFDFSGIRNVIDVMEDYAAYHGEVNEIFGEYRWKRLTECASDLGYDWKEAAAHNSLGDCYATLYSYRKLQLPENQNVIRENLKKLAG